MSSATKLTGARIELGVLVAFCVFLPIVEPWKNITWALYILCWLANRIRRRDFGGPWNAWDSLIATWMASGFVVAAFAGLHGDEWRGAVDIVRYGAVLWLVKRARYSALEIRWIIGALVASTLLGLAIGYYRLWAGLAKSGMLQLHSVGHVNHTAIYLTIMFALCVAWLLGSWRAWRVVFRVVALAITAAVFASIFYTASRAAIGVALLLLPLLGLAWRPRLRWAFIGGLIAAVLVTVAAVWFGAEVVRRQQNYEATANILSYRDGIWHMGVEGWRHFPWFGVGMDNYQLIDQERIKGWLAAEGKPYDPAQYVHFPHGHSLYLNTLAERGVAGSLVLLAVLLAWLAAVFKPPAAQADDLDWTLWGAALGAWFVTIAIGFVNTTLHHEHGILAVLLLGLWLARRNAPPAS
jgi:O-antigen ligase